MLTVGTDCSGIEAPIFALRALQVPHRHVFSSEIQPHLRSFIERVMQPDIVYGDITQRDVKHMPRVDIYVAGFPCQPYSKAGLGEGARDARANVLDAVLAYIRTHRPRIVLLENVPQLIRHTSIVRNIDTALRPYASVRRFVLNAADYGVPQQRRRVFWLASLTHDIPTTAPVYRGRRVTFAGIRRHKPLPTEDSVRPLTQQQQRVLEHMLSLARQHNFPLHTPQLFDLGSSLAYTSLPPRPGVAPTLLARRSRPLIWFAHNKTWERLNVRQALALQGFPTSAAAQLTAAGCSPNQIMQAAGNSMCVTVIAALLQAAL